MARRNRSGLPQYCSWNYDRHGRRRIRFRRGGFSSYLSGDAWSDDFMGQYADALAGHKAAAINIGADRTVAGSIDALVSHKQLKRKESVRRLALCCKLVAARSSWNWMVRYFSDNKFG